MFKSRFVKSFVHLYLFTVLNKLHMCSVQLAFSGICYNCMISDHLEYKAQVVGLLFDTVLFCFVLFGAL